MKPLNEHPTIGIEPRKAYEPMTDTQKLQMQVRFLLTLDSKAVYGEVAGSTIVYYISPHAKHIVDGECGRMVLAADGAHLRIDKVGFDPR